MVGVPATYAARSPHCVAAGERAEAALGSCCDSTPSQHLLRSRPGILRLADRLSLRRRIVLESVGPSDSPRRPYRGDAGQHDLVARRNVYEPGRPEGLPEYAHGYG